MGSRLVKYEFSPKENEQIEAVIKIPEETRSVIHGVVIDCRNRPIRNAVVKLLEVLPGNPSRMKPLTHTFTDESGQFLFGPLYCNKRYALKVWYSSVKIRELIISPDCDDNCEDEHSDDSWDYGHSGDGHSDDVRIDDYHDENYDNHPDGFFDNGHKEDFSDVQYDEICDECSDNNIDDDDYHSDFIYDDNNKKDNHQERRKDDNNRDRRYEDSHREYPSKGNRRDRHSDDDNYIHYRAPKVYGQKCTKCESGKKINNFEDIEK